MPSFKGFCVTIASVAFAFILVYAVGMALSGLKIEPDQFQELAVAGFVGLSFALLACWLQAKEINLLLASYNPPLEEKQDATPAINTKELAGIIAAVLSFKALLETLRKAEAPDAQPPKVSPDDKTAPASQPPEDGNTPDDFLAFQRSAAPPPPPEEVPTSAAERTAAPGTH